MPRVFAALAMVSIFAACTSKDGASITDGGADALADAPRTCTSNADCPDKGTACGYAVDKGCAAVGECVATIRGATGCAINTTVFWCGCDGKTFATSCDGYPEGSINMPVAHSGACTDGAVSDEDAGATDATRDGGVCPRGCDPTNASILCADGRTPCFCYEVLNQAPSTCKPGTALVAPPYKTMYCCD